MTTAPKRKPTAVKYKSKRQQEPTYGVEEMQRAMHILALMQSSPQQEPSVKRTRQSNAVEKKRANPLLEYQALRASAASAGVSVVDGAGRPLKKAAIQLALDAKNGTKVLTPIVSPNVTNEAPKVAEVPKVVEVPKVAEAPKAVETPKS